MPEDVLIAAMTIADKNERDTTATKEDASTNAQPIRYPVDPFRVSVWRGQLNQMLQERDELRSQLQRLRRQQAELAERAARLRLQIALRDKKRVEGDDIDWT